MKFTIDNGEFHLYCIRPIPTAVSIRTAEGGQGEKHEAKGRWYEEATDGETADRHSLAGCDVLMQFYIRHADGSRQLRGLRALS